MILLRIFLRTTVLVKVCSILVVFLFGNEDTARQRYFKCFIFEIKTTVGEDFSHRIGDANSEDTIIETKHKVLNFLQIY